MMVPEASCLFCSDLPATSEEHIVLNALGGHGVLRLLALLSREIGRLSAGQVDLTQ